MTGVSPEEKPLRIRGLLGIGLDGRPDEKRLTRGESFCLYGGSKETHEQMVATALRFNERVDKLGKKLPQINARDLREITRDLWE